MKEVRNDIKQVQRGRRNRSRLRVRLPAKLETRTETSRVILVDLSTTGARVLSENLPKVGTEAVLHWDKYEAFGEVVWAEGVHGGIAFFDPLTEQDVLATRELDDAARLPQQGRQPPQPAAQLVRGFRPVRRMPFGISRLLAQPRQQRGRRAEPILGFDESAYGLAQRIILQRLLDGARPLAT